MLFKKMKNTQVDICVKTFTYYLLKGVHREVQSTVAGSGFILPSLAILQKQKNSTLDQERDFKKNDSFNCCKYVTCNACMHACMHVKCIITCAVKGCRQEKLTNLKYYFPKQVKALQLELKTFSRINQQKNQQFVFTFQMSWSHVQLYTVLILSFKKKFHPKMLPVVINFRKFEPSSTFPLVYRAC